MSMRYITNNIVKSFVAIFYFSSFKYRRSEKNLFVGDNTQKLAFGFTNSIKKIKYMAFWFALI